MGKSKGADKREGGAASKGSTKLTLMSSSSTLEKAKELQEQAMKKAFQRTSEYMLIAQQHPSLYQLGPLVVKMLLDLKAVGQKSSTEMLLALNPTGDSEMMDAFRFYLKTRVRYMQHLPMLEDLMTTWDPRNHDRPTAALVAITDLTNDLMGVVVRGFTGEEPFVLVLHALMTLALTLTVMFTKEVNSVYEDRDIHKDIGIMRDFTSVLNQAVGEVLMTLARVSSVAALQNNGKLLLAIPIVLPIERFRLPVEQAQEDKGAKGKGKSRGAADGLGRKMTDLRIYPDLTLSDVQTSQMADIDGLIDSGHSAREALIAGLSIFRQRSMQAYLTYMTKFRAAIVRHLELILKQHMEVVENADNAKPAAFDASPGAICGGALEECLKEAKDDTEAKYFQLIHGRILEPTSLGVPVDVTSVVLAPSEPLLPPEQTVADRGPWDVARGISTALEEGKPLSVDALAPHLLQMAQDVANVPRVAPVTEPDFELLQALPEILEGKGTWDKALPPVIQKSALSQRLAAASAPVEAASGAPSPSEGKKGKKGGAGKKEAEGGTGERSVKPLEPAEVAAALEQRGKSCQDAVAQRLLLELRALERVELKHPGELELELKKMGKEEREGLLCVSTEDLIEELHVQLEQERRNAAATSTSRTQKAAAAKQVEERFRERRELIKAALRDLEEGEEAGGEGTAAAPRTFFCSLCDERLEGSQKFVDHVIHCHVRRPVVFNQRGLLNPAFFGKLTPSTVDELPELKVEREDDVSKGPAQFRLLDVFVDCITQGLTVEDLNAYLEQGLLENMQEASVGVRCEMCTERIEGDFFMSEEAVPAVSSSVGCMCVGCRKDLDAQVEALEEKDRLLQAKLKVRLDKYTLQSLGNRGHFVKSKDVIIDRLRPRKDAEDEFGFGDEGGGQGPEGKGSEGEGKGDGKALDGEGGDRREGEVPAGAGEVRPLEATEAPVPADGEASTAKAAEDPMDEEDMKGLRTFVAEMEAVGGIVGLQWLHKALDACPTKEEQEIVATGIENILRKMEAGGSLPAVVTSAVQFLDYNNEPVRRQREDTEAREVAPPSSSDQSKLKFFEVPSDVWSRFIRSASRLSDICNEGEKPFYKGTTARQELLAQLTALDQSLLLLTQLLPGTVLIPKNVVSGMALQVLQLVVALCKLMDQVEAGHARTEGDDSRRARIDRFLALPSAPSQDVFQLLLDLFCRAGFLAMIANETLPCKLGVAITRVGVLRFLWSLKFPVYATVEDTSTLESSKAELALGGGHAAEVIDRAADQLGSLLRGRVRRALRLTEDGLLQPSAQLADRLKGFEGGVVHWATGGLEVAQELLMSTLRTLSEQDLLHPNASAAALPPLVSALRLSAQLEPLLQLPFCTNPEVFGALSPEEQHALRAETDQVVPELLNAEDAGVQIWKRMRDEGAYSKVFEALTKLIPTVATHDLPLASLYEVNVSHVAWEALAMVARHQCREPEAGIVVLYNQLKREENKLTSKGPSSVSAPPKGTAEKRLKEMAEKDHLLRLSMWTLHFLDTAMRLSEHCHSVNHASIMQLVNTGQGEVDLSAVIDVEVAFRMLAAIKERNDKTFVQQAFLRLLMARAYEERPRQELVQLYKAVVRRRVDQRITDRLEAESLRKKQAAAAKAKAKAAAAKPAAKGPSLTFSDSEDEETITITSKPTLADSEDEDAAPKAAVKTPEPAKPAPKRYVPGMDFDDSWSVKRKGKGTGEALAKARGAGAGALEEEEDGDAVLQPFRATARYKRDPGVTVVSIDGIWRCSCGGFNRLQVDACGGCKSDAVPCRVHVSHATGTGCTDRACRMLHARIALDAGPAAAAKKLLGSRGKFVAEEEVMALVIKAAKEAEGLGTGAGRAAASTSTAAVAMRNDEGEYNCFLNVLIQSLWHLRAFREVMLQANPAPAPGPEGEAAVLQALRQIFASIDRKEKAQAGATQGGESEALLAPTNLRDALSARFKATGLFQEGEMNDAAEALQSILDCLDRAEGERPDSWVRHVFSLNFNHHMLCSTCNQRTLDRSWSQLSEVVQAFEVRQKNLLALVRADKESDKRSCDKDAGGCGAFNQVLYQLEGSTPMVLTVLLSWNTAEATAEEMTQVMQSLTHCTEADLRKVYRGLRTRAEGETTYRLRAVICYYGQHYMAFARDSMKDGMDTWTYFDDMYCKLVVLWSTVV